MIKAFKIITLITVTTFVVMMVKSVCYKFELTEDDFYNKNKLELQDLREIYERGYECQLLNKKLDFFYEYLCRYPQGKYMNQVYDDVNRLVTIELDGRIKTGKDRFPNSDDSVYHRLVERHRTYLVRKSRHSQPTVSRGEKYLAEESILAFDFHGDRFVKDFPNTGLSIELSEIIYNRLVDFRRIYAWNSFLKDLSSSNPYYKYAVAWRDSLVMERQNARQVVWKTESEAWQISVAASSGELYESFIKHYPHSDHVNLAQQKLDYYRNVKTDEQETCSFENALRKFQQRRLEDLGKRIK